MEIRELEKELAEKPQEVEQETVEEALNAIEEPKPITGAADDAEGETPIEEPQAVNLLQFGSVITNIYCGLSDFIYKKIKKSETAPAWDPDSKEALSEALTAFLAQYNVQMTPTTQLIVVVASIEAIRYTVLKPIADADK